ncbi:class I SAM-dependent methyltransferase [Haloferula chungangensis]|uniref:Class I SAM-dependent methyltransferase n=2 Tax=Haloferula chungangensis TaxID=1048331 RepID=A0ABW2L6R4_9BACT
MIERPTAAAHRMVAEVVKEGDLAVDATAGNGHDTLFLAGLVGESGRVLAFDVQEAAILSTRKRVSDAGVESRVELRHESHGKLLERVGRGGASAVMFNLGYLPGGDHAVTTEVGESSKAVVQGLFALKPGGVMTIVCYTGHPGGAEEAAVVVMGLERILEEGTAGAFALVVGEPSRDKAPFLVVVRKEG